MANSVSRAGQRVAAAFIVASLVLSTLVDLHSTAQAQAPLAQPGPSSDQGRQVVRQTERSTDRVVVIYAPGSRSTDVRAGVRGAAQAELIQSNDALRRDVLRVPNGRAAEVAAQMRSLPGVQDAYPDLLVHVARTVNDPAIGDQWGLTLIQSYFAWDVARGDGVKVAVVDCGIHAAHRDLVGKVVAERNFSDAPTTDDRCNHGTHVAGIIAATTDNGLYIAGAAPGALLLNAKVLDDEGDGFMSEVEQGIQWAADAGAKVINVSLGANAPCPLSTQLAVNYAWERGTVVVAAAGNHGTDRALTPANCDNVISVGATKANDQKWYDSNFGPEVDLGAPGEEILSLVNPEVNGGFELKSFTGTSMAAPFVAAVAALVWSSTPGLSASQVRDRLLTTADPVDGIGNTWRHGRVNAANSVGVPGTPSISPPPAGGDLWAWGGIGGMLGDGSTKSYRASPVLVRGPEGLPRFEGVSAIGTGGKYTLALRSDGSLWSWGQNISSALGDGSTLPHAAPDRVVGLRKVIALAPGGTMALTDDGAVWTWGDSDTLGNSMGSDRTYPAPVPGLPRVVAIAAGSHVLALRADGRISAWGNNSSGQIGNGTRQRVSTPVEVPGIQDVQAVAAGGHSLALRTDGTVWAWGANYAGQVGDGTTTERWTPTQVRTSNGLLRDIVAIAAGYEFSVALGRDGTVWTWGSNEFGALGTNATATCVERSCSTMPVSVPGLPAIQAISATGEHVLALGQDGSVWGWGRNHVGQIGDGTTTNRARPVPLRAPGTTLRIAAGPEHSVVQDIRPGGSGPLATPTIVPAPSTGARTPPDIPPDAWRPVASELGELAARGGHTMVWTGTEVIVWGGSSGSYESDGAAYNPTLQTWRRISSVGAPGPRTAHRAVWTGREMIVWGGEGYPNRLGEGARYDPTRDAWTPMSSIGAPSPRSGHSAVWTGTELIIWGGYGVQGAPVLDDGARYDPVTDRWSPLPRLNVPRGRYGHPAVWTGREMIIWGGTTADVTGYLGDGARFDPSANRWVALPAGGPSARTSHTMVWTGADVLIWGGLDKNGMRRNDLWRYSLTQDAWTPGESQGSPSPRTTDGVWTGAELIIWGGMNNAGLLGDGARFDPARNQWRPIASTPPRDAPVVWTGTYMVMWGGDHPPDGVAYNRDGARYDPARDTWEVLPMTGPPARRADHSAIWTGTELVIWGGTGDLYTGGDSTYDNGARFDPRSNTWWRLARAAEFGVREKHSAVWTGSEMLIWGGYFLGASKNDGARYDSRADTWREMTLGNPPYPRIGHSTVWTGREMLIWGGGDPGPSGTGSRYDPSTDSWIDLPTVGAPTPRAGHSAVWTGTEMIVWGGATRTRDGFENDGGAFNPATGQWRPLSTVGAPAPRAHHEAIWTGEEMIVWGGSRCFSVLGEPIDDQCTFGDGGRYNPRTDTWTPLALNGAPLPREFHTMVWTGTEVIVWGGSRPSSVTGVVYYADGARYSPAADRWLPLPVSGAPVPRAKHEAVWTGTEMILWGGESATGDRSDGGMYRPPAAQNLAVTPTPSVTATSTALSVTATSTASPVMHTVTSTLVRTSTPSSTPTGTQSSTPSMTPSSTPSSTPTASATLTATPTPSATASGTATPTQTADLIVQVNLPRDPAVAKLSIPLAISLFPQRQAGAQASAPSWSASLNSDVDGRVFISGVPAGEVTLRVKYPHGLSSERAPVLLVAGSNTVAFGTLTAGDADDDDRVSAADFTVLKERFGSSTLCGQAPLTVPCADFDGNGRVGPADFSLLKQSFGLSGPLAAP
jgi:alpha-tubulin suppressor-like RCC1 family protein/subtilisin family serine protease/N-acetylneuraminic acid mutarotase